MSNFERLTFGFVVAGALTVAAPSATAQFVKSDRLDSQRLNTLRALAEYVDDGAEFTLEEARAAVGTSRNARERNLMTALRNFNQQARRFHNRVDQYPTQPWRVESELTRLRTAARNVNTQLRRVPAMSAALQDWDLVIQDINDMTRVASGADVTLRRPTARWTSRVGEHHVGEWPTYAADTLRGQRLEDFRRLARELDTAATRAYTRARSQRADYSADGAQLLVDLEHFARQASQVRAQAEAGDVRPRDIGPLVTHVLEDARRADASMRRARVYTSVWDEWGGVIRTIEQMTPLVR